MIVFMKGKNDLVIDTLYNQWLTLWIDTLSPWHMWYNKMKFNKNVIYIYIYIYI